MKDQDFSHLPEPLRKVVLDLIARCRKNNENELLEFVLDAIEKQRVIVEEFKKRREELRRKQAELDEKYLDTYLEFEYFGLLGKVKECFPDLSSHEAFRSLVKDEKKLNEVIDEWVNLHYGELDKELVKASILFDLRGFFKEI
jgi:hypothetical protein